MAAEFQGAGKAVGLEVWRIEKLSTVKLAESIGKFYVGDSYILLSTSKLKSGALSHAIHFWLGSETSIDESGVAAYKTVELDAYLGGGPVQYRELQGKESNLFLSYFKSSGGITYLPGGIKSGFKAVVRDVYETKLLHLKGKRTVRVSTVPLSVASLNAGDVFILDAGLKIYIFNGRFANKFEKTKGLEVAHNIKNDDRGGRAELILMDDNPTDPSFWTPLGGYTDPATLPNSTDDDSVAPSLPKGLFRISVTGGAVTFVEVTPGSGKLTKELLVSGDVFLLQSSGKIFLWIGKHASLAEKKEATPRALQYISKKGLPSSTKIERVSESFETAAFKSEFLRWDTPISFGINKANNPTNNGTSDSSSAAAADWKQLLSRKMVEDTPIDDGKGSLEIWVINNFKKEPVDKSQYGHFFSGDSYILLYTYQKGGSVQYILYYWLGKDSTPDEKGAAALLVIALDESLGGKPVQVRVTQGKEPAHFRQLFLGKMIIYEGGHVSGYSRGADRPAVKQPDRALFHVRGSSPLNTVAVGVKTVAASLNSEDCFVMVNPSEVIAWNGLGSTPNEQSFALSTATTLAGTYKGSSGRLVKVIHEGFEEKTFWEDLGGRTEYASMSPGESPPKDARLFSASNATGRFKIEEVDNFVQSDLNDEDVFLLCTFTQLFVWIGSQSNQNEKEEALKVAERFMAEVDDGRDPDIPIIRITAGQEPIIFSCHFLDWDSEYFTKSAFLDPYQAKLQALALASEKAQHTTALYSSSLKSLKPSPTKAGAAVVPDNAAPNLSSPSHEIQQYSSPVPGSYTLDQLKAGVPEGVNPALKEEYLDDRTFTQLLGTDRASFKALPKWKKDAAKKSVGLF